jgi:hypothetical protein
MLLARQEKRRRPASSPRRRRRRGPGGRVAAGTSGGGGSVHWNPIQSNPFSSPGPNQPNTKAIEPKPLNLTRLYQIAMPAKVLPKEEANIDISSSHACHAFHSYQKRFTACMCFLLFIIFLFLHHHACLSAPDISG